MTMLPDDCASKEQNQEPDTPHVREATSILEKTKRRRLMRGAPTTERDFKHMFETYSETNTQALQPVLKDATANQTTILHRCNTLIDFTKQKYPGWSDQMVRLGAAAIATCTARLTGRMFIGDNAFFLWLIEGDRFIRVHAGFCYIYNGNGAFLPYSGIPPQSVLYRVSVFFMQLEGIFRRMDSSVRRNEDAILRAIAADLAKFEDTDVFLQACCKAGLFQQTSEQDESEVEVEEEHAVEVARQRPAQRPGAVKTWTQGMAECVWKVCQSLRGDMMHDKLIALLVEWCETPPAASKCVSYADTCVVYDTCLDVCVRHVAKSAENNCYIYIPHPLIDPVLQQHEQRLEQFYAQTFWANHNVFLCNQAALALAKRGVNVERCFIGESPGGVGQSLFSIHLDSMLGNNHGFFDPNVWFNEDELRKQVESYARCIVITGQEAPESHKKLHLDLFKKNMSGDGIAGRKPYGYTTRMFSITGWKRLEVNRMITFVGIDDSNFQSVFRRALVWKPKARFHHETVLCNLHQDHEKDGHFKADPTLKQFLVSGPACAAGLRMQHAFERRHGQQSCLKLIDDYATGGDDYLTEDKMRKSCGLKLRIRHMDTVDAGVALLEVECSQEERDKHEEQFQTVRNLIISSLLDSLQNDMSVNEFAKKSTFPAEDMPNMNRKQLWKELEDRGLMVKAHRGGTRAADVLQPVLAVKRQLSDVIQTDRCDTQVTFPELRNIHRMYQYLAAPTRAANAEIMSDYLENVKKKTATRGRKATSVKAAQNDLENQIKKFKTYDEVCKSFNDCELPEVCSPKSRQTAKRVARAELEKADVKYSYTDAVEIRSRRFVVGQGAQKCAQRIQYHLLAHTMDLDIKNCCVTLTLQLLDKLDPSPPMPEEALSALKQWRQDRATICKDVLKVSNSEGKQIVNAIIGGGMPPEKLKDSVFIRHLQRASAYLRWLACSVLPKEYKEFLKRDDKPFPSASAFYYMWTAVEDFILEHWSVYLNRLKPTHLSLHFDGVRVNSDLRDDCDAFLQECEGHIERNTGFSVQLAKKEHHNVHSCLASLAMKTDEVASVPESLLQDGNCIPCALWHLVDERDGFEKIFSQTSAENNYFLERKLRTYRQCSSMLKVVLHPCYGLPETLEGKLLLHAEREGQAHCLALQVSQDKSHVHVWNGSKKHILTMACFLDAVSGGIDHRTVVFFALKEESRSLEDEALLELQAGSLSVDSDIESNDSDECPEATYVVDDEGTCIFQDVIRDSLEEEVHAYAAEIEKGNIRRIEGSFRCTLCPFRAFRRLCQLADHVRSYHVLENQFVCSGTKRMKVVLALHDADCVQRIRSQDFLFRSALALRKHIEPPLPPTSNHIDKLIRLVFAADGPRYVNKASLIDMEARRVLNIYYDRSFAEVLFRETMIHHSNVSRF